MRKQLAAILASALVAAPALADPVWFEFAPKPGTTWRITEQRTKITNKAGERPILQGTIIGRLRIVEETDDGFLMEWVIESLSSGDVTITEADGLTEVFIGLPIRFEANTEGVPVEIHDADALVDQAMETLGSIQDVTPAAERTVRQMFSRPEMLLSTMLPQASLVGNCQGFELDPDEPVEAEFEAPNLLGGPPIPATIVAALEDVGAADRPAVIRLTERYGSKEMMAALVPALTKMREEQGLPPLNPEELAMLPVRTSDTVCHVDVKTGDAVMVDARVKVVAGDQERQDIRLITSARIASP